MISKIEFYNNIDYILQKEKIEGKKINNINIIRNILKDKYINKKMYREFCNNYEMLFGNDYSLIQTKIQDMMYRIHLILESNPTNNNVDEEDIQKYIKNLLKYSSDYILDAVSYDDNDLEIMQEFSEDFNEFLCKRGI